MAGGTIKRILPVLLLGWLLVQPVRAQGVFHVKVDFKNGTSRQAYVFYGNSNMDEFLEYFKSQKQFFNNCFEAFPAKHAVNDGGAWGGYAFYNKELENIPIDSVASLKVLPDPYNGQPSASLSQEEIQLMQNPLVCMESDDDDFCLFGLFNYNPSVSKRKLQQYLSEALHEEPITSAKSKQARDDFLRKMKSKKIIAVSYGCDTSN